MTSQYHGFGYFEDILDSWSKVTVVLGTSNDEFQIPNSVGKIPSLGLTVNGQTDFPSVKLNENQTEITHFGVVSYLHSQGQWDFQLSGIARYSSLNFTPDPIGDLLFNGIAQKAYKRDVAYGVQGDSAYHLNDQHTIRAGFFSSDRSGHQQHDVVGAAGRLHRLGHYFRPVLLFAAACQQSGLRHADFDRR